MRTQSKALPHVALTCSGCGKVLTKKGTAEDFNGISPFLHRKAKVFETPDEARAFAQAAGWKCDPKYNEDFCQVCVAPKNSTVSAEEAKAMEAARCEA